MDLNKNIPFTLSHTAPAGPREVLAHLFGSEGKAKITIKGKKKKSNLPTYQHNVKAAKLLWKQAAPSTALPDQEITKSV